MCKSAFKPYVPCINDDGQTYHIERWDYIEKQYFPLRGCYQLEEDAQYDCDIFNADAQYNPNIEQNE